MLSCTTVYSACRKGSGNAERWYCCFFVGPFCSPQFKAMQKLIVDTMQNAQDLQDDCDMVYLFLRVCLRLRGTAAAALKG